MNLLERYFRRRALQQDPLTEDRLPPALRAVPPGTIVPIFGFNFRVVHRRCGPKGEAPGLVLAPVGPTRRRLKNVRARLKHLLRRTA
jgi:hypothetical protein